MTEQVLRMQLMLFALLMNRPPWWRFGKVREWRRNCLLVFAGLANAAALSEESAIAHAKGRRDAAVMAGERVN